MSLVWDPYDLKRLRQLDFAKPEDVRRFTERRASYTIAKTILLSVWLYTVVLMTFGGMR
jgi:hypothetical protein